MNKYRHPRFLSVDNREYVAEMSVRANDSRMTKLREPGPASAASRIADAFEGIVREALTRISNISDNRILAYEESHKRYGYLRKFRELDAIAVGTPMTVFEIKTSRSEKSALNGRSQLRKTGEVIESGSIGQTNGIALVLIWIDTGGDPTELVTWRTVHSPDDLSIVFQDVCDEQRYCFVRISAEEAWAWRRELDVVVEDYVWEQHEKEKAIKERRRALREAGVDPSDWPMEIRTIDGATRWEARDQAAEEDSTIAMALRRAFEQRAQRGVKVRNSKNIDSRQVVEDDQNP